MEKLYYLLLDSSILAILLFCKHACTHSDISQKKNMTYLHMWEMPYTPDWNIITHSNWTFIKVNLGLKSAIRFQALIDDVYKHGVKVLLSIGSKRITFFFIRLAR